MIGLLIRCLDQEGFFPYTVQETAGFLGYSEVVVEKCLERLKTLEPAGIFSQDISECLKRQLIVMGVTDKKLLLIVEKYMPDILKGQIGTISRSLKLSTAQIKEYIHLIGSLNFRPVMNLAADPVEYIVPDILAAFEGNDWQVKIDDNWMGEYIYNDYYIRMMRESKDPELVQYFREKLERARFIINCVEQRRATIIKVVMAILELQGDYFKSGAELKPMSMEEVAQIAGIHVSTVSRAIKDKSLQYKKTVFLKELFTSAAPQGDISVNTLKAVLKQQVEEEDKQNPLSDLKISEIMAEKGFKISRRTVAKYRQELGIPESRQRIYL